MEQKKVRTKKEQRAESDAKLLKSAIKLFGENGYSNTSLSQIAKGAGLTSGLIVQRYETKENLLFEAWKKAVSESFTDLNEIHMIPEGLFKLIDEHRELYSKNNEYFCFLKMLLERALLPESFDHNCGEVISRTNCYFAIVKAQQEKRVVQGDPYGLIKAFISQVINQIDVSEKYGVEFPEYDFFLQVFGIVDNKINYFNEQRKKIYKSYFNGFNAICYVYIKENTVEELILPKEIEKLIDPVDAISSFRNVVENTVHEDYKQKLVEFYDFNNLNEKFRDRSMIHVSVKNQNGKDRIYILSVAKRNNEGEVLEFLMTIHDNN